MRCTIRFAAILTFAGAATALAQGPVGARPGIPAGGSAPAAKLLLSSTGELGLTDQQVVRLAAIARRSEARRVSMRAAMDSARIRFTPGDTAGRRQFAARMRADAERAREQQRADQRDAIAILTPDQQAKAWEMVANRGRAMRGSGVRGMRPARGMRQGGMVRREVVRDMQRRPMPGRRDGARPVRPTDR
ncbi:MAG TPA: Spy/CpxP family protein refolding chaperone [Gemmatimonadaceae bacterium]|nr:Spy/CpxP family protein refolding chaperone [Gemmatimonadaceae bacterium]